MYSKSGPRKAVGVRGRAAGRDHRGRAAGAVARPPAALHRLQLQNGARGQSHLVSDVLHLLYAARQPNGAADHVCGHKAGATARGRPHARLRGPRIGRADRRVAQGEIGPLEQILVIFPIQTTNAMVDDFTELTMHKALD